MVSWIRNNTWKAQRLTSMLMKRSGQLHIAKKQVDENIYGQFHILNKENGKEEI